MTTGGAQRAAVVLIAHGTVASLDDLPEFLTNIRRGAPAPPALVAEVRRRYEAIGGGSPLLDITRRLAAKVEGALGVPTRPAMRLFHPYPKDVIRDLVAGGARRIIGIPLAQHSAAIYGAAVRAGAAEVDPSLEVACAPNWGRTPALTRAFADVVLEALAEVPASERTAIVYTAHSLPVAVIEAGDPYEAELRASAADVAALVGARTTERAPIEHRVAFQSEAIGATIPWLGPGLQGTLEDLARGGVRHVVLAPIGFLADHVEILYDLDVEANAWARDLGIVAHRTASLNDSSALVDAIVEVAGGLLGSAGETDV